MEVQRTYLKELRIKAGLTQQEVADKIGVTKATISKYEKGQRGPNHIEKLAELYGVDPMYILTGKSALEWQSLTYKQMEKHEAEERKYWESELLTERVIKVMGLLERLNESGQEIAIERIEELTEMSRYQKSPPQAEAQDGEEGGV